MCHAALRRCYELLLPTGWPEKPVTDDTIDWCIETAVEQAAEEQEILHRTGHYLLWELAKSQIIDVVTAAVDDDTRAYLHEPFLPIGFEVDADGNMDDLRMNAFTVTRAGAHRPTRSASRFRCSEGHRLQIHNRQLNENARS